MLKKSNRIINVLCSALFGIVLFAAARTEAFAYDDVTDIVITVGYWGDVEYEKADIPLETLESDLPVHQEIYTWINRKPGCGTTAAEGVCLTDLFEYADIDMNAVRSYNFFTMDGDGYAQIEKQWTNEELFGARYTFISCFQRALDECPDREDDEAWIDYIANPQNYFRISNFFSNGSYLSAAWQDRMEIEPMLALRVYSVNWDTYPPESDPFDFSQATSTGMPELMFGQSAVDEKSRQYMAQMICRIHIWYDGSPTITSDASSLEGETGDTAQISLQVLTPDAYLTQMVKQNITWTSDDESVATVDRYGNVTFVGEGEATIYASYGNLASYAVPVSASEQNDDTDDVGSGNDGSTSDSTSDSASGSTSGGTSGVSSGSGSSGNGTGNDDEQEEAIGKELFGVPETRDTVTVLDADADNTASADAHASAGADVSGDAEAVTEVETSTDSDSAKVKIYQISEYIEELTEEETDQMKLLGGGVICILAGVLAESLRFRYQTGRRKKT